MNKLPYIIVVVGILAAAGLYALGIAFARLTTFQAGWPRAMSCRSGSGLLWTFGMGGLFKASPRSLETCRRSTVTNCGKGAITTTSWATVCSSPSALSLSQATSSA